MTDQIRIGVLGTARINRRIVADLQSVSGLQVTAIASRDATRATWSASQLGIGTAVEGYETLVAREDIDAVYIPLPPSLHAPWANAALRAGKHVLVEKPLALNVAEAEAIDAVARQQQRIWLDATAWLYHPRTQHMNEVMRSQLAAIRHVSVACSFFRPFQANDHRLEGELGGGCLLDLGWYAAGAIAWAFEDDPITVRGVADLEGELPMRVSAVLDFPGRRSATLNCGYDMATRKWFEIAGEEASLICDDFTRPWADRAARFWVHDRAGAVSQHAAEGHQEQRMAAAFRDAIRGQGDVRPHQVQALRTQRLIDAISEAIAK